MKAKINSYFAVLIVTIAGAGATMLIVHVATANAFGVMINDRTAGYAEFQQSLLE